MNPYPAFGTHRCLPPPRDSHPKRHVAFLLAALVAALVLGAVLVDRVGADEERYEPAPRGSVERWRPLISRYDWDTDTALAVILCESRGDPEAVNPTSGATGLWQLLGWDRFAARLFGRWVSLTDPDVNTRVAYALYVDSGERFGFHWRASMACWAGGW